MVSFESSNIEEISFGKWLTYKIQYGSFFTFHRVFNMYEQNQFQPKELIKHSDDEKKQIVVKLLKAEKFMYMTHVYEEFNKKNINDRVLKILLSLNKKVCLIEDFIFALTKTIKYFSLNFTANKAQIMVYYLICDLILQNATDEFNQIFKAEIDDIELNKFTIKKMNRLEIRNTSLLCSYSYFILKREADRVLSLIFFMISIKDFKKAMVRHLKKNIRQERKISFLYQFDPNDKWETIKKVKKHKRNMTPIFHRSKHEHFFNYI